MSAALQLIYKKDVTWPIIMVLGATLFLLTINTLFFKSSLQLGSIFGYDPVTGSRFFGIGNESMSIIIASSLLFAGLLNEKFKLKNITFVLVVFYVLILIILGFPRFGAQTDAPITAGLAFAAALFQANDFNNRWRWLYIIGLLVAVLAAFIGYDYLNGSSSHMGRTLELVKSGGLKEITKIVQRKLLMNIKLLRVSTWSYFLIAMFGLLIILMQRPIGLFKTVITKYKYVAASITGGLVGGIIGFTFNDSGIVIPAIIFSYFLGVILVLMLDERCRELGSGTLD